eukprot:3575121-Rhodomonas_salina.1
MEAVRVSRAGFPVRIPHSDFVKRFAILIPPTYGVDDKTAAGGMCEALRVPKEHYRSTPSRSALEDQGVHAQGTTPRSCYAVCGTRVRYDATPGSASAMRYRASMLLVHMCMRGTKTDTARSLNGQDTDSTIVNRTKRC